VRRIVPSCAFLVLLAAASLPGCGSHKEERGLTPAGGEQSDPTSKKELSETEAQRQKQMAEEVQQEAKPPKP
jgi:hypothetical protein